jgi:hypothetical protein
VPAPIGGGTTATIHGRPSTAPTKTQRQPMTAATRLATARAQLLARSASPAKRRLPPVTTRASTTITTTNARARPSSAPPVRPQRPIVSRPKLPPVVSTAAAATNTATAVSKTSVAGTYLKIPTAAAAPSRQLGARYAPPLRVVTCVGQSNVPCASPVSPKQVARIQAVAACCLRGVQRSQIRLAVPVATFEKRLRFRSARWKRALGLMSCKGTRNVVENSSRVAYRARPASAPPSRSATAAARLAAPTSATSKSAAQARRMQTSASGPAPSSSSSSYTSGRSLSVGRGRPLKRNTPAYSFGERIPVKHPATDVPGPGQYNSADVGAMGSKRHTQRARTFCARFSTPSVIGPGPGEYNLGGLAADIGRRVSRSRPASAPPAPRFKQPTGSAVGPGDYEVTRSYSKLTVRDTQPHLVRPAHT